MILPCSESGQHYIFAWVDGIIRRDGTRVVYVVDGYMHPEKSDFVLNDFMKGVLTHLFFPRSDDLLIALDKEKRLRIVPVATSAQLDDWSCGYRALAAMAIWAQYDSGADYADVDSVNVGALLEDDETTKDALFPAGKTWMSHQSHDANDERPLSRHSHFIISAEDAQTKFGASIAASAYAYHARQLVLPVKGQIRGLRFLDVIHKIASPPQAATTIESHPASPATKVQVGNTTKVMTSGNSKVAMKGEYFANIRIVCYLLIYVPLLIMVKK